MRYHEDVAKSHSHFLGSRAALLRAALLGGASLLFMAGTASAQQAAESGTAAPAPQSGVEGSADTAGQDIVVTASRLSRSGYTAPTPTTVIGQEFLESRAITNVGDAINRVPAFRAAVSPNAGGLGNTGAFLADLRGLGPTRTLVLLDRGRLPQTIVPGVTTTAGSTDLNVIPTVLIRNSDVVTGGASAAYGSDAVAGVINFQIDDKFEGIKGSVQYSQTRYKDAKSKFATLAGGTSFADGRGHIVAGFEYNDDGGTGYYNTARGWGRQAWNSAVIANRPAGTPSTVLGPNGNYYGAASSGGVIQTAGALRGLAFVPTANGGVTTTTFSRGLSNMTASLDFFTPEALAANAAAGINNLNTQQLRPEQTRYSAMGRVSFDLNDSLTVYVEPLYSNVTTTGIILVRRDGAGAGPALNIARDNPYLAQALTAEQLAQVPTTGLAIGYSGQAFGPNVRRIENEVIRVQSGVKGDLGGSWKWDASYLFGQNTSDVRISNNFNNVNFRNALDAVSVDGQIVCRNAAARAAGCVPINILGTPHVSDAAKSYILGTATGRGRTRLHDFAANIQGEPFSTWAGPVSVGVGAEYRRESVELTTDALSRSNSWLSGTGLTLPQVSQNVKEVYAEAIVPLAQDMAFARKIEFNGAARLFLLNGKVVALHGVGLHQDSGQDGWALSDSDIEKMVSTIREMGANTIRLTHYQHGPVVHALADKLGLILWDEIPLVTAWTLSPDEKEAPKAVADNARQQLVEMIRQNYNHPSVAVWGIANEVDFGPNRPDFIGKAVSEVPDPRGLLTDLNALAKAEDPIRRTVLANCCENNGMPGVPDVSGITDGLGVNRYMGWYYGKADDFSSVLDGLHQKHAGQPLALTEYGAGGATSQHSDDPQGGPINASGRDQPEEYQAWLHERVWPQVKAKPYLWGSWLWNSFDFATKVRKEGDSIDINTKGLVTYDGAIRKDAWWYYRVNWSAQPAVQIAGKRYVDRAYGVTDVKIYSNAPETELLVNGTSIGTMRGCAFATCVWPGVRLTEGQNRIEARARFANGVQTDGVDWTVGRDAAAAFRIDSGAILAAADPAHRFGSDAFFDGGAPGTADTRKNRYAPFQAAAITGTANRDQAATYRSGDFTYHIPAKPGRYTVILHFVEPSAERGKRVFDVAINGKVALPGFDVAAAAGGTLKAITRSLPATAVKDGLTINFKPTVGDAIVSALEVVPIDTPRP